MLALLLALWTSAAAPAPDVVLFLGDSLTAGYGISLNAAFPSLLEERWKKEGRPLRARNAGISGSTTAGALETLDWTLAPDVKVLFVCIGANDGLRGLPVNAGRDNLSMIVQKAKAKGIKVVLAGMRLPPNYGKDYAARFEAMYGQVAGRHKVDLMPFLLKDVAGVRELNLPDGIHPNEKGHEIVAANVHAFLESKGYLR